jgi:hypothetical protein
VTHNTASRLNVEDITSNVLGSPLFNRDRVLCVTDMSPLFNRDGVLCVTDMLPLFNRDGALCVTDILPLFNRDGVLCLIVTEYYI